ncbi:MAG: rhodanese-like domain-containing protein [Acidimicrobiia bacterium]|nr:rhodanese-like domain-containing protein [Acidimicrobiia bacterium]
MKTIRALLIIAFVAITACGGSTATETTIATEVAPAATLVLPEASLVSATPQQAAATIDTRLGSDGFVLLDVRTPEEYAEGHIAGSDNIDFYEAAFADSIAELDRDASYVVYCHSGNRSSQTLELMRQLGFTDVTDVAGGIVAWAEAGLPIQ